MSEQVMQGGSHAGRVHYVEPSYWPAWRGFEQWCGTMADDECEHGKTPAERRKDPDCCECVRWS